MRLASQPLLGRTCTGFPDRTDDSACKISMALPEKIDFENWIESVEGQDGMERGSKTVLEVRKEGREKGKEGGRKEVINGRKKKEMRREGRSEGGRYSLLRIISIYALNDNNTNYEIEFLLFSSPAAQEISGDKLNICIISVIIHLFNNTRNVHVPAAQKMSSW